MKKRTGLSIAGGILEIIAGVYWLSYSLFALIIYSKIENGLQTFDWVQLILPLCFILFGIMAIIGKRKKDLVSFGVINLLFVAYIIYKACIGATTLSHLIFIILLFSGEIILLLISSFFFFFTKKSEYEIVFDERIKIYKEQEPIEHKRYNNIYFISTLTLVCIMSVCIILSIFVSKFVMASFVISICCISFVVLLSCLIIKKDKGKIKYTTNIVINCCAVFILLCCSIFSSLSFSYTTSTMNPTTNIIFSVPVSDTYIYYNSETNNYELLIGKVIYDYDESTNTSIAKTEYEATSGNIYTELPDNAIVVINRYNIKNEDYYSFLDTTTSEMKYYCENNNLIVNNLPNQEQTITNGENKEDDKIKSLMLEVYGIVVIIAISLVLTTKDIQMTIDVKKLLRQEEQQKTIDKYAKNQQGINLPPRPPKLPISGKGETQ